MVGDSTVTVRLPLMSGTLPAWPLIATLAPVCRPCGVEVVITDAAATDDDTMVTPPKSPSVLHGGAPGQAVTPPSMVADATPTAADSNVIFTLAVCGTGPGRNGTSRVNVCASLHEAMSPSIATARAVRRRRRA